MGQIGEGSEARVFEHPYDGGKVVKEYKKPEGSPYAPESELEMKARYYLTKVMHLLYPGFVPDVHLSSKGDGGRKMEVDKIEFDPEYGELTEAIRQYWIDPDEARIGGLHELKARHVRRVDMDERVARVMREWGRMGIFYDTTEYNIGYTPMGEPVYMDNFSPWTTEYDPETGGFTYVLPDLARLRERCEGLSDQERMRATKYLERYENLYRQRVERG